MSPIPTQFANEPITLDDIDERWRPVVKKYKEATKHDLLELPYAHAFLSLPGDDDKAVEQLEGLMSSFKGFRKKGKRVLAVLKPMVHFVHLFIDTAAEAASTHMPSGKAILIAIGALLQATKGVSDRYNAVEEALGRITRFLERVQIHLRPKTPPDAAVMDILLDTFVQVFVVITIITKYCSEDKLWFKKTVKTTFLRANDYVSVLFGKTDLQDALNKLGKLAGTELEVVVAHNNAMLRELHDDSVINSLRSWLCAPQLSKIRRTNQAGNCAWFLEDSRFKEWMTRKNGVYWVYGIPGSGKSVLWSSVVDKLEADSSLHVIHFYFDYSDPARQDSSALLSSLVFQLGTHSVSCLSYLKGERTSDPPTDEKLRAMLSKLLALSGRTFLVIDALDECPEPARDKDLFKCLEHISRLGGNDIDLRVLVTSRPEPDIRNCMSRLASYILSLNDSDKHNDELSAYVSNRLSSMRSFRQWSVERRAEVQQILVKKSEGMFLWVDLQFQILAHCSPSDFEATLNALPSGLNKTYERILTNFPSESIAMVHRARHVFECIAYTQRPLSPAEVLDVFCVKIDITGEIGFDSDPDLKTHVTDAATFILERCPSLLSVSVDMFGRKTVQFIHFSIKEYFTSAACQSTTSSACHYFIHGDSANITLARICLLALDINSALQKFKSYAQSYWHYHVSSRNEVALGEHLRRFLGSDSPLFPPGNGGRSPDTAIHWTARLGLFHHMCWMLRELSRDVLVNVVNARGVWEQAALDKAAYYGYVNICKILLEHGALVDDADAGGKTPLYHAVFGGHLEVARLLLTHTVAGSDVTARRSRARDSSGQTALHKAAFSGDSEMCSLLLEHGALVDDADAGGKTPLHYAALREHLDVARVLLTYTAADGSDVAARQSSARDLRGQTALHMAADKGEFEICSLLLEHGALVDEIDVNGWIPLHHATYTGHLDISRLLLTHTVADGSDVAARQSRARDSRGQTALHVAADYGRFKICSLLLEHGALVDDADENSCIPLHLAARKGYLDVARDLLTHVVADGSDIAVPQCRARDSSGQTALHMAANSGHTEICSLLLQHGALVDDTDEDGRTSLHYAMSSWCLDLARLLLTYPAADGSDVAARRSRTRDSRGRTALHMAANSGHTEICSLLLEHGALVDDTDENGRTPLHYAVSSWCLDLACLLLTYTVVDGSDVAAPRCRARDSRGQTALHIAAAKGGSELCGLLLEHGALVDDTDENGWTPLHHAARIGHVNVVGLLLTYPAADGFDVAAPRCRARDSRGQTALHIAAAEGVPGICSLLLEHGALLGDVDAGGNTPLDLAKHRRSPGQQDVLHVLSEHSAR